MLIVPGKPDNRSIVLDNIGEVAVKATNPRFGIQARSKAVVWHR